ncbi:response regulator [Parafilimonas sp.]|uniref:response regulator n=1 Tax=Parafilimonas sp. TaxID=1969739 RepID=UPI003F7D54D7
MLNTNNDIKLGIADDNKFFREALSEVLNSYGFTIIFKAVNGYDCIDKIKSATELPDVCILDVFMPEIDGFETARIIKKQWPKIKLIACSTNNEDYIIEEILAAGVDKFLSKGSEAEDVRNAIIEMANESIL